MSRRKRRRIDQYIEEMDSRQRNILWPEATRNASLVDRFLWKGNPNATLVQRAGAWMFGMAFAVMGLTIIGLAYEESRLVTIFGIAVGALGVRVFINGCR